MTAAISLQNRILFFIRFTLAAGFGLLLQACGTTRPLPPYEPPLARADFQTVRTTAYTHTESDHLEYGNRNALGGTLRAALPPARSASAARRALLANEDEGAEYQRVAYVRRGPQPFRMSAETSTYTVERTISFSPAACGSAAADWSRWPAGTVFRVISTGQLYRVDDYGWALSGRNTIDLYMATPNDMNSWGLRSEPIQILRWGDPRESLRFLARHQDYRHIKRMVLELEGHDRAAARLH